MTSETSMTDEKFVINFQAQISRATKNTKLADQISILYKTLVERGDVDNQKVQKILTAIQNLGMDVSFTPQIEQFRKIIFGLQDNQKISQKD